jgi:nucleotide-binding universal stress UspA family protein
MGKILVAYDGSENSKLALKRAITNAKLRGDEIIILEVIEVEPGRYKMYGDTMHVAQEEAKKALRALGRLRQQLNEPELRIEVKTKVGHPVEEIVKEAEESEVDVIYIGSKGLSGLSRVLMGSVAEGVVRHAPCNVIVVRRRISEISGS